MATTWAPAARHLHAVAAHAAGADHHGRRRLDAGAAHRLVGRGQRIGHDGHRPASARLGQALLVDRAQPRAGTTMWVAKPPWMSLPASWRGRWWSRRGRWCRSHSYGPHGSTAGTMTARLSHCPAPAPAVTTRPLISWPSASGSGWLGARRRSSSRDRCGRRRSRPPRPPPGRRPLGSRYGRTIAAPGSTIIQRYGLVNPSSGGRSRQL